MKQQTTKVKPHIVTSFNPFSGPEIVRIVPITQSQAEIWTACVLGGEDANRAYNESISLILKGNLNRIALEDSIQKLIGRHESLQATFSPDGRFMIILNHIPIEVAYQDISQLDETQKNKTVKNYLSGDANYIFDLVKGPLFKVGLLKLSEIEHQLILTAHHIICDGWSLGIMLEELGGFYSAIVQGVKPDVPRSETFSSYVEEEQEFLESQEYIKTEKYWLKQFETSTPTVTLPTDFQRPRLRTFNGDRLDFTIDSDLVTNLKKVGIQSRASFVVTLLAAFEVFLYHKTGQDDLVLGLPAAGQSQSGKTQLIGHCVNLLPLRSKLVKDMQFNTYLKNRKAVIFDAYDHQQFSFGQLLQKLAIARDPSRVPLVPIMFNIDMGMASAVDFNGLTYDLKSNPRAYEAFELFLNASGSEEKLTLEWSYNNSLFKPETIEQMMVSFKEVLNGIVTNPEVKIGDIIKVDDSAYTALNDTLITYPQLPLHTLLTNQVRNTALKQAVKFGDSEISYEHLEKRVNQLSHYLVEQGIGNGDYVGVSLPRSIDLVVTLIAIMKCGAAYLPLDPNFPDKRLKFMLEDSEAKFLITTKEFSPSFKVDTKVLLSEDIFSNLSKYAFSSLNISIDINDVAYIMYTSGSTGKPKGVMVTHKNLVNFLCSMMDEPGIKENDKLLSITTISFDIAGLELFLPLLKGATLVIANDETAKDSRLMLDLLKDENITMLQATPTTWQMLLDAGWEETLPIKALCGGEALPIGLAKKILKRVHELWNVYGPTETTIWSAVKRVLKDDEIVTIGHPIANTQLYILNEQDFLVAPNMIGEICIAGDGVSNGYWKRSDLTNEKFIKNPFETKFNQILYRTGDLGKLLPTGEVQCLGRIDHQVKIRGHRIELGEIEQVIDALDGVDTSVVIVKNDLLVANIVSIKLSNLSETLISNWKKSLTETLPVHMVPQQFNLLSEFPTTLNGKIDRKALIKSSSINCTKTTFNAAQTNSEQIIATIWQECLGIEKIDIHSDFFELGGHSLIAVKVMSLIEKKTGNRLPLAALLGHPTIQKLAAYMDKEFISWDSLVPLKTKGTKDPLFVVHGANYNILIYKDLADHLDDDQPVYALQAKGLSGEIEPHDSVEAMASHYISEITSVQPDGPYALAGFSFGGIIAFEMAKQLKAQGKKVKTLALLDSYVYPSYYYSNPFVKKVVSKLYDIAQLVFMAFNMFSSKNNFKRRSHLLKLKVEGLRLRLKYGREKQQQMQFNRTAKIDKKHQLAFERYNLTPQDIQVDLFRATKNIFYAHDYNNLGWRKITLGGIRKHMVPGNHSEMFLSPAVEEFGSKLQHVLDNFDSESSE
ncbi:amino acid adenylation domain-containing protein [Aquimarina sp. 2201CG5-10]|uniref:non-ribosomal peptide synthetase n=1 Tax=Aquimarina callyspongiae TaxID=3098150 RepID=UPI002AB3544F|nr:amino acid adenylation domain-containing protein [Aquimarina sp. 2201CG5-10]MDY8134319.1 amino acid adenylation domain-containing protein [Aquimarina sp. 2201CG5-10]